MNFSKFLQYDVGDGTRVKFWEDVWCKDCSLKEAFPEFYHISRACNSSIAEVMQYIGIYSFVVLSSSAQLGITILTLFVYGFGLFHECVGNWILQSLLEASYE